MVTRFNAVLFYQRICMYVLRQLKILFAQQYYVFSWLKLYVKYSVIISAKIN